MKRLVFLLLLLLLLALIATACQRQPERADIYLRGAFGSCPDVMGALGFGSDPQESAADVALRFARAFAEGDRATFQDLLDPPAASPDARVWSVSGQPDHMRIIETGDARDDGLVSFGCGTVVARRTWTVILDDGTESASLDFTLFLVRRADGWKVWGSY